MAFSVRNLSVLAYANGFTLWHYRTAEDPLSVVGQQGFFVGAAELVSRGDIVMVSAPEGARLLCVASAGDQVITETLT